MNPARWLRLLPVHVRMVAAMARSDYTRAIEEGERAVAIDPRDPSTMNILASAYEKIGDARAIDLWHRALDIDPSNYDALRAIGEHHARGGDSLRACPLLRRALECEREPRGWSREWKASVTRDRAEWRAWAESYLTSHDENPSPSGRGWPEAG